MGFYFALFGNNNYLERFMKKIITSESVNIGHPDKTCDVIADTFLDEALKQDPNAQMAVECAIKDDKLFIYGEATTTANIDYEGVAKQVLKEIGYSNEFVVIKQISKQSPDINQAVEQAELKANDQGMVYGYACNETEELMPLTIMIAHDLMKKYDEFRRGSDCYFADAKSQVSVCYEDGVPQSIDTVLISVSHGDWVSHNQIVDDIKTNVVDVVLKKYAKYDNGDIKLIINPSGRFTIWGSFGDSGCVGRKIVVDTYGGIGRVGGGCFSSKNATKVDRSGAYYARYVAKNIVAHGLADRCEIQLGFAIGMAEPVSIAIETFGTNHVDEQKIEEYVKTNFNFKIQNIIDELELKTPIFKKTASFGHFGRSEFPWERIKN